jgi:hypothetical protein
MMGNSIYLKNSEKQRNAYLLFYERKVDVEISDSDDEMDNLKEAKQETPVDQDMKGDNGDGSDIPMMSENEESKIFNEPKLQKTTTLRIRDDIIQMIAEENRKYWQYKFIFAKEYTEFILEFCSIWNTKHMVLLNYDTRNRDYHIFGIDEDEIKSQRSSVREGQICSSNSK